jgi:hypothetical protein
MLKLTVAFASLAALGACASMEPEPCTSEWVEWKTERVLTNFARSNYSEINRLRKFSQTLEGGNVGPLTALKIPGMIEDFKELAEGFERKVRPELNLAVDQCSDPQKLIPAFTGFLRKEGVGEDVLEWVEVLGAFVVESET